MVNFEKYPRHDFYKVTVGNSIQRDLGVIVQNLHDEWYFMAEDKMPLYTKSMKEIISKLEELNEVHLD